MAGCAARGHATARGFWLFVGWAARVNYDIGPDAVSTLGSFVGFVGFPASALGSRACATLRVKVRNAP